MAEHCAQKPTCSLQIISSWYKLLLVAWPAGQAAVNHASYTHHGMLDKEAPTTGGPDSGRVWTSCQSMVECFPLQPNMAHDFANNSLCVGCTPATGTECVSMV